MDSERSLDGRIAELKLLTKARSSSEFVRHSPAWLSDAGDDETDSASALTQAINRLDDPLFRNAALALFPLPYVANPGSLTERRTRAAEFFSVSPNTFRSGTATRPSYEDQVLGAIVTSVGESLHGAGSASANHERRRLLIGGLIVTVLVVALVAIVASLQAGGPDAVEPVQQAAAGALPDRQIPKPPDRAMSFSPEQPPVRPPDTDEDLRTCPGRTLSATPQRQARVQLHLQSLGVDSDICQDTSPTERWEMSVVKYLTTDGVSDWVDLEFADGAFLVVPLKAWTSYRSLRESSVDELDVRPPSTWSIDGLGRSELQVGQDAVVIGSRWWLPHYFVTEPFLDPWLAQQKSLGDPMADTTQLSLQLEHGSLRASGADITPIAPAIADSRAALPSDDRLRNSVLQQEAGPAWFVDASFRRWWIPDQATFECLTRDRTVHPSVPRSHVASLDLAGIASCEFEALG